MTHFGMEVSSLPSPTAWSPRHRLIDGGDRPLGRPFDERYNPLGDESEHTLEVGGPGSAGERLW